MKNGMASDARARVGAGEEGAAGVVVMGLDQHRAQITADWLDTATGELGRQRVAPGDRIAVRQLLAGFSGRQLEVALEATTGWRFVVEELDAVGAVAHLAEPAQASALRENKRRAKTDRAAARLLRELLLSGRLPESWIAPSHLLDLRARVRLRHALGQRARRVAPASPSGALPPWASATRRSAQTPGPRLARAGAATSSRARAGHARASR